LKKCYNIALLLIFIISTSVINNSSFGAPFQNNNEVKRSTNETQSLKYEQSVKIFTDIGIPIITVAATIVGGLFTAKYIVGNWQKRKETSEIRNEILKGYTVSFKVYVTLMDTFVARIVMEFAKLSNDKPNNKPALSELLPWGYTFKELDYYSKKIPTNSSFQDYEGNSYKEDIIEEKFKKLYNFNKKCYVDFEYDILKKFRDKNEIEFKNDFYKTRGTVLEFAASLNQYYAKNTNLSDEFSGMWQYMMSCYILVNKIIHSKKEQEFIDLIRNYNESAEFLYDMLLTFEKKLIRTTIVIE
jgi:hypothetical protein